MIGYIHYILLVFYIVKLRIFVYLSLVPHPTPYVFMYVYVCTYVCMYEGRTESHE